MISVSWRFHLGVFLAGIPAVALSAQTPARPALVIHGGAGNIAPSRFSPAVEAVIRTDLTKALTRGYEVLERGGSAVDAVETAIRVLEDAPCFNAGKGAVWTSANTVELDASIMDGATPAAGAVASVRHIKNPISLARRVMTATPHVLLVGPGAEAFAREQGIDTVSDNYFRLKPGECGQAAEASPPKTPRAAPERGGPHALAPHPLAEPVGQKYGTVGAVALDRAGSLAAGTSTGGLSGKRPGRVGDSPIIGAGTYASNHSGCAVSATGAGEYFIRHTVAVDICKRVEYLREPIDSAAHRVIHGTLAAHGGTGGVIVLDRTGQSARVFNTTGMFRGYIGNDGKPVVELYK